MQVRLEKETQPDGKVRYHIYRGNVWMDSTADRDEAVAFYEAIKSGYPKKQILMSAELPDEPNDSTPDESVVAPESITVKSITIF